jgi:hypothetical protein
MDYMTHHLKLERQPSRLAKTSLLANQSMFGDVGALKKLAPKLQGMDLGAVELSAARR